MRVKVTREPYVRTACTAAVALAILMVPFTAAAPADEGAADVLFVTDDSPSMQRNDPAGNRIRILKAMCDLLLHPGGGRAGILRIGGALETEEKGAFAYPFREIPQTPDEKAKVLFEIKAALDDPMTGFGRGTDFNALFDKGVFDVLRKREDARQAIVVLVTDGSMNVIEGNRVLEEYRKAAAELPGGLTRENLTRAALGRFRSKVLPLVRDAGICVIPVALSRSPAMESAALAELGRLPLGPGGIVELGEKPSAALEGILRVVGKAQGYTLLGAPLTLETGPGEEKSRDLWIPTEASSSRILVLGPTDAFSLSFTDVSGSALGAEEGCSFYGPSEKHRVISLGRQTIPNRILKITNRSEEPASFRVFILSRFQIQPRARVVNPENTAQAASPIRLETRLLSTLDGEVVRDKWLVERTVIDIRIIDSSGERLEVTRNLSGADRAMKILEVPLSRNAPGGIYVLQIRPRIDLGSESLALGVIEDQVRVVAAKTLVRIEFGSETSFPDVDVPVLGMVDSGKVEAESLAVQLVKTGDSEERMDVTLTWNPTERRFEGSVRFPYAGYFEVRGREEDHLEVVPGLRGGIDVSDRRFVVLDDESKPIDEVVFSPDEEGNYRKQIVEIVGNLAPGEDGSFTIVPELRTDLGQVTVELQKDGEALPDGKVALDGEHSRQKLALVLVAPPEAEAAGEIGTFRIQGRLGKTPVSMRKGLRATPRPPREVSVATVVKDKRLIIAAAAVGGLLILALLYWVMLPRFRSEYVVEIDPSSGEPGDGTLISEMHRGFSPRKAAGMPDVTKAVQFQLGGLRPISKRACFAKPLKPFIQVFVNGKLYMGPTRLRHGDHIKLRGARFSREYIYFDHPVTEEDWRDILGKVEDGEAVAAAAPETGDAAPVATMETEMYPTAEAGPGEEAPIETLAAADIVEPAPEESPQTEAMAQLDTIFSGTDGEEEAAEAPEAASAEAETAGPPQDRKVVTLEDFFGSEAAEKVRVEEGHVSPEEEAAPSEEPAAEPADEQATVLESFFSAGDADAEATAEEEAPAEEPTIVGDHTEIVAEEDGLYEGDRTEMVGAPEGDETDFFDVADDEEEPSILIDMPLEDAEEPESAEQGEGLLADTFRSEGAAEEAPEEADVPADLKETQETVVESSGILSEALREKDAEEDAFELTADDEDVEIIESGTEEFLPLPEEKTILQTAYSSETGEGEVPPDEEAGAAEQAPPPPAPAPGEAPGQIVVVDEVDYKKLKKKEK
jgi:hypothetical protein